MGVRREGSGKSRSTPTYSRGPPASHAHASSASGAIADNSAVEKDSDEDSDPDLQEVYVQAYACQMFRDDAAAAAVEDGVHLRPLAASQEPGAEPLLLDRFDARWMLDISDLKKGAGSTIPPKLIAEERQADSLRYASLPSGDHSQVVEGLDQFAPSGSYAHGGKLGGLGDEDEEEPQPEVYGYYGRTASPPPSSSTTGSGAWASTPAPHYSVENDQNRVMAGGFADGDETAAGARGGVGGGGGGGEGAQPKGAGAEGAEAFVPDFGVPQGVVAPATVRQHIMMVGTARTAVRSPQLEVLLRLKQQSNLAFSFLSDEDPIHPYYVFLKSWGENALAAEYTRQQRLQAERAEARRRAEEERKEREERAAAAKAAKEATPPPPPPGLGSDDSDADAPNLLGGAYESSEEEEDPTPAPPAAAAGVSAITATAPATGGLSLPLAAGVGLGIVTAAQRQRNRSEVSPLAPDEDKRQVVEKMVGYVAKNGPAFEDRVRSREKSNPTFDFLVPTNRFHAYYKMRLALAKGDASAEPAAASAATHKSQGLPPTAAGPDVGVVADTRFEQQPASAGTAAAAGPHLVPPPPGSEEDLSWSRPGFQVDGDGGADDAATNSSGSVVGSVRGQLGEKLALSRIDDRDGKTEVTSLLDPAPNETNTNSSTAASDETGERSRAEPAVGTGSSSNLASGEEESDRAAAAVVANPNPATIEDAETRRANRLKRARLMTGHYKLAVMEHSSDRKQNAFADVGGASSDLAQEARPFSGGGGGGGGGDTVAEESDGFSSADGLSDLDGASSSDESESGGDAGTGADDAASEKASGKKPPTAEGERASTETETGGRKRESREGGGSQNSTTRNQKPRSGDSTKHRNQGRRDNHENDDDGGRRYGRGSGRKGNQSSGSERRRDNDRTDVSRGDDRRSSRKGRSRSRSRSTSRGRSDGGVRDRDGSRGDRASRRPGSDRDRSSGGGNRSNSKDSKGGGRGERSKGDHGQSSKPSSSRKSDSRGHRDKGKRERDGRERAREQSRSDRGGDGDSSTIRRGNESRHEKERESRRRSRSRDREESRERGGSTKRSRRR